LHLIGAAVVILLGVGLNPACGIGTGMPMP
jgi:hypothetical protein